MRSCQGIDKGTIWHPDCKDSPWNCYVDHGCCCFAIFPDRHTFLSEQGRISAQGGSVRLRKCHNRCLSLPFGDHKVTHSSSRTTSCSVWALLPKIWIMPLWQTACGKSWGFTIVFDRYTSSRSEDSSCWISVGFMNILGCLWSKDGTKWERLSPHTWWQELWFTWILLHFE